MPREFSRIDRVADFIKRELALQIQNEMRDPRARFVTVTDVEVSRDLAHANVYVTVVDQPSLEARQEILHVLSGAAGFLRGKLSRISQMRTTPELHFFYDESSERGAHLSQLIDQAIAQDRGHGSEE